MFKAICWHARLNYKRRRKDPCSWKKIVTYAEARSGHALGTKVRQYVCVFPEEGYGYMAMTLGVLHAEGLTGCTFILWVLFRTPFSRIFQISRACEGGEAL